MQRPGALLDKITIHTDGYGLFDRPSGGVGRVQRDVVVKRRCCERLRASLAKVHGDGGEPSGSPPRTSRPTSCATTGAPGGQAGRRAATAAHPDAASLDPDAGLAAAGRRQYLLRYRGRTFTAREGGVVPRGAARRADPRRLHRRRSACGRSRGRARRTRRRHRPCGSRQRRGSRSARSCRRVSRRSVRGRWSPPRAAAHAVAPAAAREHAVRPAPPDIRSGPAPPSSTSAPGPPMYVLRPPVSESTSSPAPPSRRSASRRMIGV